MKERGKMKTNLNIDGFIQYAEATGKFDYDQLDVIRQALYSLEGDMAELNWKKEGMIYSCDYIASHLTQCGNKLKTYMMTGGLKQAKAASAVSDFKKWFKAMY